MKSALSVWLGRRGSPTATSATHSASRDVTTLAPARRSREVEGTVALVEQRSVSETVPALVAILDGTSGERIKLIWLGRTGIRGIEAGARLRARGLVTTLKTMPAIYNPTYDLLPACCVQVPGEEGTA